MTKDEKGYRLIAWEIDNANLISCRRNGRKGGRKKNITETNPTETTQSNITEQKRIERNGTGGLTQQEPRDNPGFFRGNQSEAYDSMELNDRRVEIFSSGGLAPDEPF